MKIKLIVALMLTSSCIATWQPAAAANRIGYVSGLEGNARSTDAAGRVVQLQVNSPVREGVRIETDPESRLRIRMDDGAELHMKGDTQLKISEYVITEGYGAGSKSILELLRGGLRAITGAIGASPEASYQLQTGVAAIGIRGTDYVVKLCRLDDCTQTVDRNDAEARLHAVVLEGAISLTTDDAVQMLMARGEYGTASRESLVIADRAGISQGLLNAEESRLFADSAQLRVEGLEQETSAVWKWVLGILLLAAAL